MKIFIHICMLWCFQLTKSCLCISYPSSVQECTVNRLLSLFSFYSIQSCIETKLAKVGMKQNIKQLIESTRGKLKVLNITFVLRLKFLPKSWRWSGAMKDTWLLEEEKKYLRSGWAIPCRLSKVPTKGHIAHITTLFFC